MLLLFEYLVTEYDVAHGNTYLNTLSSCGWCKNQSAQVFEISASSVLDRISQAYSFVSLCIKANSSHAFSILKDEDEKKYSLFYLT